MRISDWSSDVCSSDLADRIEQFFRNARRDVAARMFGFGRRIETRPAPGEPVGLVRLVGLRRLEIAFEPRGEFGAARVGPAGVDHAFILQLRSEARRVGEEGVMTCRSGVVTYL